METLSEALRRIKQTTSLKGWCDAHLQRMGKTYVCPCCGSGTGPNRTPAFTVRGDGWKCFSCGARGDVFDIAGIVSGTTDKAQQAADVAAWSGVDGPRRRTVPAPERRLAGTRDPSPSFEEGRRRERTYLAACRNRIADPRAVTYLAERGFSVEQARAWGWGYDPCARGWTGPDGPRPAGGRIVIPFPGSDFYHIDRAVDPAASQAKYVKPSSSAVGTQPIWNPDAIRSPVFFVVEGPLDAAAVEASGFPAVALCGTGWQAVAEAVRSDGRAGVPVLMLDNDDEGPDGRRPGQEAQSRMASALGAAGVACVQADLSRVGAKDAAEAAEHDRSALAVYLGELAAEAEGLRARAEEERYATALSALRVLDPRDVAEGIWDLDGAHDPIPTGWPGVDESLGGGLPAEGLVTVGAVSSVGKTTWCVQLADQIAASGRPVLYVTIEQSAREIVAKSLSRLMSDVARADGSRILASSQAVASPRERARWQSEDGEKEGALLLALNRYEAMTHDAEGRLVLHIMEADGRPTAKAVRVAAEHIARGRAAPVVFVDYLQLLAPPEGHERDSDKQVIDQNVMALRQMARDLSTCVVAVSSLNRSSYSGSVDMEAFKESGAIEYGSDVLLGLQPKGMEESLEDETDSRARAMGKKLMREFKSSDSRDCELVVLKNRHHGLPRRGVHLVFDAVASLFSEA